MIKKFLISILIIVTLFACELNDSQNGNFKNKNLSGHVRGIEFNFVEGSANTTNNNQWCITLGGTTLYPYLFFYIEKDSIPQKYNISTYGTNGLILTGYITPFDGTWYDTGEIEILEIDTSNNVIRGRIWGNTNEDNSYINGNFSAVINN